MKQQCSAYEFFWNFHIFETKTVDLEKDIK